MTTSTEDDEELLRCISAALEMRDQGLEPPLEEICGGRPELVREVAKAIGIADRLPGLQRDSVAHDHLEGQVFEGRYRLVRRLGAGAMGVVYEGVDLELERPVAVKILHNSTLAESEAEQRFSREAEALASIQHPSVVTVFDRGRAASGQLYIVMELLRGESLDDLIEAAKQRGGPEQIVSTDWIAQRFSTRSDSTPALVEKSYLRAAVRWTADLAAGLSAAHAAGVFHRDLKPSNIFVREDGRPALIDFGIAARAAEPTLTAQGSMVGTPAYMAPETLQTSGVAAPSLDVYGLSATLYHLLTLRAPYSGTPSQIIAELARRDPMPADRLHTGIPRDLQAILDKGLARGLGERYRSAADLEDDLRAFLDYRPIRARPVAATTRVLRRFKRSAVVRAGALWTVVVLVALLAFSWNGERLRQRRADWQDAWARIPPGFTLWRLSDRTLTGDEFARMDEVLGEAVRLCDTSLPSRLYRAAFRADHGDHAGAAEDLRAIADEHGGPYVEALALLYRDLDGREEAELGALSLEGLPEPRTPMGKYLAGYHVLRVARSSTELDRARWLLSDDVLAGFAPALEILLPVRVGYAGRIDEREERIQEYRHIFEEAVRLEENIGRRTALTAHVIGAALLGQERYAEALEPIREGIELAPFFHGLRNNMGVAAHHVGALEEAREHLEIAIEMRPEAIRAFETLVQVYQTQSAFEAAHRLADRAPYDDTEDGRQLRALRHARIECERTLRLLDGDPSTAREAARAASTFYGQAGDAVTGADDQGRVICAAIASGDHDQLFVSLLETLESEPSNWRRLLRTAELMPDGLNTEQTTELRDWFRALAGHFAPQLEPLTPPRLDTPEK